MKLPSLSSILNVFFKVLFKKWKKIGFSLKFNLKLTNDLELFYFRALKYQYSLTKSGFGFPKPCYYEFGVGLGRTLSTFIGALKFFCKNSSVNFYSFHIFGFDSFEGLPEKKNNKDNHYMWHKGLFSKSLSEIKTQLREQKVNLEKGNIHLIKGFFEETLTENLKETLRKNPPTIITIDVDYYSSTKLILEWLRPILVSGTVFYFDDIWSFFGHPDFGELSAINEFNSAGGGQLIPFPLFGLASKAYIYYRKDFEFKGRI